MVLAVLVVLTASASAATLYVGAGETYETIQAAVDAASAGDTIIVREGSYDENVNVNIRLTIEAENDAYATTVTAEYSNDHVFEVTADYVNISWFKVEDATGNGMAGIYLAPTIDHCNISYNNATDNFVGIRLNNASYNNISHNNASYNGNGSGIGVGRQSNHNTVDNNTASNNTKNGIGIGKASNYNTIRDNDASDNTQYGIYINGSNYTDVFYNDISDNTDYGVKVFNGYYNDIYYNDFIGNGGATSQAWDDHDETVNNWDDDDATGNYWGDYVVGWPFTYSIDGGVGQKDNFPSGPP